MAQCEMCGKSTELVLADIEGVELKVCDACARFGTIRKKINAPIIISPSKPEEPAFTIVHNYASLLRMAREKRGFTQEDFAKFLKEKESVVAHWEAGTLKPGIEAAQRLGKLLGINFIEREEIFSAKAEAHQKADELTLGDFVKVRKRK